MAAQPKSDDESQIRTILETRTRALRDGDVEELMANVDASALHFDVVDPLQYSGANAIRRRELQWLQSFAKGVELETRDLQIETSGDTAFCHSLNRVQGESQDGRKVDMWVRTTYGWKKKLGRWLITHQHISVPFNAETGKSSLQLKP